MRENGSKSIKVITALVCTLLLVLMFVPTTKIDAVNSSSQIKVDTGDQSTIFLVDGKVYISGENFGEFFGYTGRYYGVPVLIDTSSISGQIVDVSLGYKSSHLLTSNGEVYSLGQNGRGHLGVANSTTSTVVTTYTKVDFPAGAGKIVDISTNPYVMNALDENGDWYTWGEGPFGGLGNGDPAQFSFTPKKILLPNGVKLTSLSSGRTLSAGIGNDGYLYVSGQSYFNGEAQDNYGFVKSIFHTLYPNVMPTKVVSNSSSMQVLGNDGEIYNIGANFSSQLGDPTRPNSTTWGSPVKPAGVTKWVKMYDTNYESSMVVGDDGKVYAYGYNAFGTAGIGSRGNVPVPTVVKFNPGTSDFTPPAYIANTYGSSVAIMDDGSIYTWGSRYGTGLNATGHVVYPTLLTNNTMNITATSTTLEYKTLSNPTPVTLDVATTAAYMISGNIEKTEYFIVNTTDTTVYNTTNWDTGYNASTHKGIINENPGGVSNSKVFSLPIDTNGKYWIRTTYQNTGNNTNTSYLVGNIIVTNIYDQPEITRRGINTFDNSQLYAEEAIPELENLNYGIAFEQDNTILSATSDGVNFVTATDPLPTFTIAPKDLGIWWHLPASQTVTLDSKQNIIVEFEYSMNQINWSNVVFEAQDTKGNVLTQEHGFNAPLEKLVKIDPNILYQEILPEIKNYNIVGYKINSGNMITSTNKTIDFTVENGITKIVIVYDNAPSNVLPTTGTVNTEIFFALTIFATVILRFILKLNKN